MNDLWENVQEKIKKEIGHINYSIWISHMKLILLTEDTIILSTENKHVSNHIEENYKDSICKILHDASGRVYTLELREKQEAKEEKQETNDLLSGWLEDTMRQNLLAYKRCQ